MKKTRLTLTLLTACAALPVSGLLAQAPATAAPLATPSVSAPASTAKADATEEEEGARGGMRAKFMALSPEEKQKVKAARKAAMQDPAVKAAEAERGTNKRAYHQAMRAAMIKADPSVEPILAKLTPERHGRKNF